MTTFRITHPMADEISVIDHSMAHARKGVSSEIAFFKNREWVNDPVPPFEEYHEETETFGDTSVYGWVPNDLISVFLDEYEAIPVNR